MEAYVIGIKIWTDKPLMFKEIPGIIKEAIDNGDATIVTAETYESWQEEQEKK